MSSRDGRWLLAFNGELYQHQDLRLGLDLPWRGHCGHRVVGRVAGSARFGRDALPHSPECLRYVALDREAQKLYLARDPFGIKPIYFSSSADRFAFSSEIRGLRALGAGHGVDPAGLDSYLALRYTPSTETLIQGVGRLPPGSLLTRDALTGSHHIERRQPAPSEPFSGSFVRGGRQLPGARPRGSGTPNVGGRAAGHSAVRRD